MRKMKWHRVNQPLARGDLVPPERKTVLVWLREKALPFCGYIRYAAGDRTCPFFVVYHGNPKISAEVIAWCDCLPGQGPDVPMASMYSSERIEMLRKRNRRVTHDVVGFISSSTGRR